MSVRKFTFTISLIIALICSTQAIKIEAKAILAQHLIENAWAQTLKTQDRIKPWSWADTWPVMRIIFSNGEDYFVLHGMSGQALAFGPAHLAESAMPGNGKDVVIAAHRDTHFSGLKNLVIGDEVLLEDKSSQKYHYRIISARIVDTREEQLYLDDSTESLRLITCFPFDAINPNGPLRYEIVAVPKDVQIQSEFKSPNLHTAL